VYGHFGPWSLRSSVISVLMSSVRLSVRLSNVGGSGLVHIDWKLSDDFSDATLNPKPTTNPVPKGMGKMRTCGP